MKRCLPSAAFLYALLCITVLPAAAQVLPVPPLKAPSSRQTIQIRKSPHLNGVLQKISALRKPGRPGERGLAPDNTGLTTEALSKYLLIDKDRVLVNITLRSDVRPDKARLQSMGVDITGTYGRMMSAYVPLDKLEELETVSGIQYVRPVYKMKSQLQSKPGFSFRNNRKAAAEPVISQGDVAQGSNLARQKYRVSGKGVRIGILSDSYNSASITDLGVADGELPGSIGPYGSEDAVQVLQDFYENGTDEGRALAEILHDVAPNAELAFHTASYGQANFAKGILDLADIDCKVIIDDALYPDEPFFQDGIIAQAVNTVQKKGVTYFSAAGNKSTLSYESIYRPTDYSPFLDFFINGTAHNFSAPDGPPTFYQPINIPPNTNFMASFQWNQPFFSAGGQGAQTDMDIFLLDANGTIVAASVDDNITSGDPLEIINYTNNTSNSLYYVTILKFSGPDPTRLKYVSFGDEFSFYSPTPAIPGINSPALIGHPNAAGAIAVGAANFQSTPAFGITPPQAEYFSSQGGVAKYWDAQGNAMTPVVLKKPEIVAPDGGNTSFFYVDSRQDVDDYPNFFGTSAAAAHAAGVAALMIEAQKLKTITPAQIMGFMGAKAIDMDDFTTIGFDAGFDYKTGAGLLQADAAVDAVRFPKVYVRNLQVRPVCSSSPSSTRNYRITNPNPFEVEAHWLLVGFPQYGSIRVQPGDTVISTNTGYLYNREVPNLVLMDWEDNFGFPHLDVALSNKSNCSNPSAAYDGQANGAGLISDATARPDVAEAFPNPFNRSFKVYVSCPGLQQLDLELFGVDGKQVMRKRVAAEGVITMDASTYRPGVYYLKVSSLRFNKTIQLIKL